MDISDDCCSDVEEDRSSGSLYHEEDGDGDSDVPYDGTDSDDECGFVANAEVITSSKRSPYLVLNQADLKVKQDEVIQSVTTILGVSKEEALKLLRSFKWEANRLIEEWFVDSEKLKNVIGTLELVDPSTPAICQSKAEQTCRICFDNFKVDKMLAAHCGHHFCQDCWSGYIGNAVQCGPSALDLRCPLPECRACVPINLIHDNSLNRKPENWLKYKNYALSSFVDDNASMAWCTGAGCQNAVECLIERGPDEPLDVICTCQNAFCFNCKEEAHRPVSCETVRKWITKSCAESENLNWILANTKTCPSCQRHIEKNQGCMHMSCSQCKFEFCWLCRGSWKEHGESTGGYYGCNKYEVARKNGEYTKEEMRRENAKQSLERYMHYYERFVAHHKARAQAKKDAVKQQEDLMDELSDMSKMPTSQMRFTMDAWNQIVECRRMLKWTYAYGYYEFLEDINNPKLSLQRNFFEFLQGDAERSLEKLHEVLEVDLNQVLKDGKNSMENFQDFRKRLIGLTDVTRNFFAKLVKQLERGFEDLDAVYGADVAMAEASSSALPADGRSSNSNEGVPQEILRGKGGLWDKLTDTVVSAAQQGLFTQGFWACPSCSFHNSDMARQDCEVCGLPR